MDFKTVEKIIEHADPQINRGLKISREEYIKRWRAVQAAMKEKGYDLCYACGSELDRSDIAWLVGIFDPIIERYGILIPAVGEPVVVAGSEGGYVIEDCLKASGLRVVLLQEYQISDEDYRFAEFERLEEVIFRMIPFRQGKKIKIAILSSGQFLPHDHLTMFQGRFGADNVVFDVNLLQRLKYEKSPTELEIMAAANRIADAAFLGMLSSLSPGVRELDVAAVGEYIIRALGGRRCGFPTIVSSGPRGRSVLGPATNRVIEKGEFVSMGISPTFNGYHGIMRRTVKVGEELAPEEKVFLEALEGLYHTVMKAVKEASEKKLPSSYIDRKGKEYLKKTELRDRKGRMLSPREPYTFIHNTGCSECQEGFGAVTPYSEEPLGENVALMIDVALMGFDSEGELVFPVEYAVIEDGFWKRAKEVGVYNRMPLNVQDFVSQKICKIPEEKVNPYFKAFS
ncbi:MAG: M24 family metallopeptidase [Candidatus Aminicenantales bacterium]